MKDEDNFRLSKAAENHLTQTLRNEESGRTRHTERDDRATTEQVLYPRTCMILYKMLNHGIEYLWNSATQSHAGAEVL
ncbi:Serine/threonine-protein kinase RIO1 [Phytophthora citrophthora]|uniref:Serine/threonine-protein kinase RIO1 n=1 Tax=Phytophthora citrophthora TaxID=4793 RepID=A0AAD9GTF7_9STRA|nr:Serine/threonine-protein kinase RIO1 [Phytophthora citrophthora]